LSTATNVPAADISAGKQRRARLGSCTYTWSLNAALQPGKQTCVNNPTNWKCGRIGRGHPRRGA
jgi:hypothetical protein